MTTLTETQSKQNAIMRAVNQVAAILGPVQTGLQKRNEFQVAGVPASSIERLALQSDFISNDFVKISVIEKSYMPGKMTKVVNLEGPDFGLTFAPYTICEVKKQLEKSFKAVESFTKKAAKGQPARPTESPAPASAINQVPETLTKDSKLLKKDSETVNNDSEIIPNCTEDDYICSVISPIRETRPWYYSTSKSSNPTPTTLDEFLSETWKSFATI